MNSTIRRFSIRLANGVGLWLLVVAIVCVVVENADAQSDAQPKILRVGIIGLDTSHSPAFTKLLNDPKAPPELANCRVVIAYPHGSKDIESSASRIPRYTAEMQDLDVEIAGSIEELLQKVDCVLLETNDGRRHVEQAAEVFRARKPVFIDKPLSASLEDAYLIYIMAEHYKTPVFSSSSLRFSSGVQSIREGELGRVFGCNAYSPCSLESTHPDLFWYGIHGVELLFTAMGPGCERVVRTQTEGTDVVTGTWSDGRIGVFRGIRQGKTGYGGVAFGEKGIKSLGDYEGYRPLVIEIVKFFRTGTPPVKAEETLDLYAFMEAADESKRNGFVPVDLAAVKQTAEVAAKKQMAELLRGGNRGE